MKESGRLTDLYRIGHIEHQPGLYKRYSSLAVAVGLGDPALIRRRHLSPKGRAQAGGPHKRGLSAGLARAMRIEMRALALGVRCWKTGR